MLNDRDNKYEAPEESEYHFSDDEVSYEVEPETSSKPTVNDSNNTMMKGLSGSKRMAISLVVFLVLVFVVYKMVSPTTTPSSTITTANIVPEQSASVMPKTTVTVAQPAITIKTAPTEARLSSAETSSIAPSRTVIETAPLNRTNTMPVTTTTQTLPTPSPQVVVTMPSPQGEVRGEPSNQVGMMAAMVAENDRLINQLQTDYTQKLNDFTTQNKNQADQIQALNIRVASMETQLSQLVRVLTNGNEGLAPKASPEQVAPSAPQAKIAYNVQAIIPGRAWLKSDNGETVTVAEGDMLKGVGKIAKIDPYDGVVEINTGDKIVSLSYGSGD